MESRLTFGTGFTYLGGIGRRTCGVHCPKRDALVRKGHAPARKDDARSIWKNLTAGLMMASLPRNGLNSPELDVYRSGRNQTMNSPVRMDIWQFRICRQPLERTTNKPGSWTHRSGRRLLYADTWTRRSGVSHSVNDRMKQWRIDPMLIKQSVEWRRRQFPYRSRS